MDMTVTLKTEINGVACEKTATLEGVDVERIAEHHDPAAPTDEQTAASYAYELLKSISRSDEPMHVADGEGNAVLVQ